MANPELDVKRLCLDIEEFLEYTQSEDLIQTVAEVVSWLKENARTIDGREARVSALYEVMGRSRSLRVMNETSSGDNPFHPPTWEGDTAFIPTPQQPLARRSHILRRELP